MAEEVRPRDPAQDLTSELERAIRADPASDRMRALRIAVRSGELSPKQVDDQCRAEGLGRPHQGWQELHDITANSVWWLPQAVLFYAWQDLEHTREQWERFSLWEESLWRDPTDNRQVMSLEEAEAAFRADLSAGIIRAFAASGDGPVRPIPCEVWDTSRIQRWRGSAALGDDGISRFVGAFVLRHEVVPLLISEHISGSQALAEPVRRERVDQPAPKRGGGRPLVHDWAAAAGFVARDIVENDYPTSAEALAYKVEAWFKDKRGKSPAFRELQAFAAEVLGQGLAE